MARVKLSFAFARAFAAPFYRAGSRGAMMSDR
jgi:hypothetical protein